jgi:mono/diheme cytochrome c family protein
MVPFLAAIPLKASPHVPGFARFHEGGDAEAVGGAILFSELGCANCHGGSAVVVPRRGPELSGINKRVKADWIESFLKAPESGRAGSTMPAMFHGLKEDDVAAVTAYLGSLSSDRKVTIGKHVNAERGSALYHEKGCVACHEPTDQEMMGTWESGPETVAFPNLKAKTDLTALAHFLSDSSVYRPDGRMPHLGLEAQEAADIAAHFFDFQGSDPKELPSLSWPTSKPEVVARGAALVSQLRCASCHDLPGAKAPESGHFPTAVASHCLSEEAVNGLPHYNLAADQRAALLAYLKAGAPTAPSDAHLTLAAMNCYACHARDGVGGPTIGTNPFFHGDEGMADSGRLAPPLTGIGHKLQRKWMEGVFTGAEGSRVRSYVKTQMPVYAASAKPLADWLEKLDVPKETQPMVLHAEDLEAGRKLLGILGGVNCITCHQWDGKPSLGIQSLDLASLDQRLRPDWFRSYLLNPAEYRPGTLMPPLWPGGQSMVPDVLGGDTERQISAIWTFIAQGEGLPEGFPDRSGGQFTLVPTERPILQRTFLEGVGTKSIMVGFPGEISLAYDGAASRPALIWRGEFFDAYHTWFTRAAPFEHPAGKDVTAFAPSSDDGHFQGYKLDPGGNPTFLSQRGEQKIEEHFAVADGAMVRTIHWNGGTTAPAFTHPEGLAVETEEGDHTVTFRYRWE